MQTSLILDMIADARADELSLGCAADQLTFGELRRRAIAGAAFLAGHEVSTVAYLGLNGPSLAIALFSSGWVGKTFAPLNYRLTDGDLAKLLRRLAPVVAIVDDDMVSRCRPDPDVAIVARSRFDLACRRLPSSACVAAEDPDVAVKLFTSGTTGEPKAAILRHANLTAYVTSTVEFASAGVEDASLVCVPPYHIAGVAAVLTSMYAGRRLVHLPAFTAEAWVDVAARERITQAMVVPTMLGRILDHLELTGHRLPDLRAVSYGGGRMPTTVIERALRLLPHVDFVNAYGLTETSSTIAMLGPEDHRAAIASSDPLIRRRLGSVGRPLPVLDLEIRGPSGEVLGADQSGEIYVRGPQVSGEYEGRETRGADGWFGTNDGGWIDAGGYLFVEGRLDDVIVRGGENISPGEVEDVLREHGGVADVAVFGAPDDQWGERVAAVVVPRSSGLSADDLAAFARTRLRSTKTPDLWIFRDALPYNDMGKLLRRQLKADLAHASRGA